MAAADFFSGIDIRQIAKAMFDQTPSGWFADQARFEALNGLDQSQVRDLEKVFVGLVCSRETFEHVVQKPLIVAHHLVETGR